MKFSYNWIRELVPGLDVAPKELERLITMKTAESEGVEEAGAQLAERPARRACFPSNAIEGRHNVKAVVETGALWHEDGGVRRAELPRGHGHGLVCRSARKVDQRRRKRRHARQRRRTRHQPRPRRHRRTRRRARACTRRLRAGLDHRDRQQVAHAPAGSVGPLRHGARSRRDHRAGRCRIRCDWTLLPDGPARRSRSPSRISTCARVTARWCSRTSRSARRRCGCSTAWNPSG